ncbi:MAG: hypothetical protein U0Q07_11225 [Acidimicrobiales bacterium]
MEATLEHPAPADPVRRARLVRRGVIVLSAVGIAGMIAGSILDNNGFAITFGLITAVAVGFLILLTAVIGRDAFQGAGSERASDGADARRGVDERIAADVEARIERLVEAGADEGEVRRLVTRAVELGRS